MYYYQMMWPNYGPTGQPQQMVQGTTMAGGTTFIPYLDVYETANDLIYTFDMPGVTQEQLAVEITENNLVVSGSANYPKHEEQLNCIFQERPKGTYSRAVALAPEVDIERSAAHLKNGVLEIHFPKKRRAGEGRKIVVREDI
ncbi:MAG: Hsp20/alpha crystallin family protein [Bacillota bacterium]